MTNHIAAAVPKIVGDGLVTDHGETVVSPNPGPSVNRMAVTPKAANAPPKIEAHSTADAEFSTDFSATVVASLFLAMAVPGGMITALNLDRRALFHLRESVSESGLLSPKQCSPERPASRAEEPVSCTRVFEGTLQRDRSSLAVSNLLEGAMPRGTIACDRGTSHLAL